MLKCTWKDYTNIPYEIIRLTVHGDHDGPQYQNLGTGFCSLPKYYLGLAKMFTVWLSKLFCCCCLLFVCLFVLFCSFACFFFFFLYFFSFFSTSYLCLSFKTLLVLDTESKTYFTILMLYKKLPQISLKTSCTSRSYW